MIVNARPVSRFDAEGTGCGLEGRRNPRVKAVICSTGSRGRKMDGKSLRLREIKPDQSGSRLIAVDGTGDRGSVGFSEAIKPNQSKSKRIEGGGICFALDCSTVVCEEVIGSGRVSTGSGLIQVNPSEWPRMTGLVASRPIRTILKSLLRKWHATGCAGAINRQLTLEIPVKHATFRH
jgi:hypothetical protein